MRSIILICLTSLSVGCATSKPIVGIRPAFNSLQGPVAPTPVPSLYYPKPIRMKNYVGVDETGDSGGSCFHVAVRHCYRSSSNELVDNFWYYLARDGYEGPESFGRMLRKLDTVGIPYLATNDGDTRIFDIATQNRRDAAIFYYPNHAINFLERTFVPGLGDSAILFDSNYPDRIIRVDWDVFVKSWKYYGGKAVVPWLETTAAPSRVRNLLTHWEPIYAN